MISETHPETLCMIPQLHPETLHLAVNLFDRYCTYGVVSDYVLLGCVTLLIAAKYRDDIENVQRLGQKCCSLRDRSVLTQMEWHVLQKLDWEVGHPTVVDFQQIDITTSIKALHNPLLEHWLEQLSLYLAEITLYHREFASIRPSIVSSCTLALAHDILRLERPTGEAWTLSVSEHLIHRLSTHLARPPAVPFHRYVDFRSPYLRIAIELYLRK